MIVDFMPSSKGDSNYIVKDIGPTFVEGNSITKYKNSTIMYYAVNRTIDDDKNENIKKLEIIKKEKAHFKTCFLKQFHERLQNFLNTKQIDNDFEDDKSILQKLLETAYDEIRRLMLQNSSVFSNKTNAELLGFKKRDSTRLSDQNDEKENAKFYKSEYIEDRLADLQNYCNGILTNYINFTSYIIQ